MLNMNKEVTGEGLLGLQGVSKTGYHQTEHRWWASNSSRVATIDQECKEKHDNKHLSVV